MFVFLFFFTFINLKSLLFLFQATDIWAIGVTLYCFVIGRVSLHVLYFTYIQVCKYMYFVKLISEEKKLNRLYNTFIDINFIDTKIYHFIWNLIYLIIHSVRYNEIFCHAVSIWGWLSIKFTQENYEWPSEVPWKVCVEFIL